MKRSILSIFAVLMAATMLAAPRSVDEAQQLAKQFLSNGSRYGLRAAVPSQLKLAHTALQADQQPAFYVFNKEDNGGFVVVSADDNARQILGYADAGSFNEADMPENMKVWFQRYAEEIAYAAQQSDTKIRKSLVKRAYTPIEPLLGNIKWDQGKPYNNLCPIDKTDNKRSYTGCVATAAAQIMRYWKHPVQGTGSHTDNWDNKDYGGKGSGSETANFGATTYDWDNMLESYKSGYNDDQATAVATLMYHVGISCDMCYGSDKVGGSGAFTPDMAKALYTYFKYDKGIRYIKKDYIGSKKFEEYFLIELAAGRPILMGGATTDNEGHEFVCDGVDKDGYFHINWGWGGSSNNYFALDALDPDQQGAGGAASGKGFSVDVEAVIGIQPDKGNPLSAPLVAVEYNNNGKIDYSLSPTEALKSEAITFSTSYAYNEGPSNVTSAPLRFGVYTKDSVFVKEFGAKTFSMNAQTTNYQKLSLSAKFENLEPGEYLLALIFRTNDEQPWSPIPIAGEGEYRVLRATADSIFIGNAAPTPGPGPEGDKLEVDEAFAVYHASKSYWTLVLYDKTTEVPWVQMSFDSGSDDKIAGMYDLADGVTALWLTDNESPDVKSESGQLKLKCITAETSTAYAVFDINGYFHGNDNNDYVVQATLSVSAQDDANPANAIELKDKDGSEDIENISTGNIKTLKVFRNGVLIIETENASFNILGTKLK